MQGGVKQILESTATTSDEFYVFDEKIFILLTGFAAGSSWLLQIRNPDGVWRDIADADGGVSFDSNGLQLMYAQAYLPYRLKGGAAGAKAWLISAERAAGRTS